MTTLASLISSFVFKETFETKTFLSYWGLEEVMMWHKYYDSYLDNLTNKAWLVSKLFSCIKRKFCKEQKKMNVMSTYSILRSEKTLEATISDYVRKFHNLRILICLLLSFDNFYVLFSPLIFSLPLLSTYYNYQVRKREQYSYIVL